MNRRLGTLVLVGVFCWLGNIPISGPKDRLVVGYTAMTGVKAGMWVAVEANLFDKYNIQPHREDSLQCARRRSGGLEPAAIRNPKAKQARPESFYDDRFVKELDAAGFYKQLWK